MPWDYPQTGAGSGLPAGGSVGQVVVNTGPGTGSWQSLASHFAEYTFTNFSVANSGEHTVNSTWASVQDSDSFGSTLNSNGQFVIPTAAGAGLYVVVASCFSGSNLANFTTAMLQKNGADIGGLRFIDATSFSYAGQGAYVGTCAIGDSFNFNIGQGSGAGVNFSGRMSIAKLAGSTSATLGIGLTPIAKTGTYTAVGNVDWVLCDTTGGTFAVSMPAAPSDKTIVAVTWKAGVVAPTLSGNGNTILGSPTFGAVGNTIWLQFSTVASAWLVV